ncbi:Rab11 [Hexamita inflata]|uniref:Rab11 n=1 Tax=Hexamita inflata TaxID=28002 RepID=A0AA86UJP0_9EUKA|nr:Rab11 [Hexamita inflata]
MNQQSVQKILLIGSKKSGKTQLLSTYQNEQYTGYIQTIGVDFCVKTLQLNINGKQHTTKLQIWDTAGEERFQTITTSYFRGASGVVLLFNVNDADSFKSCQKYLTQIEIQCSNEPKILLLGNSFSKERQVCTDEAVYFAEQHNLMYAELTEHNYRNIENIFVRLASGILYMQQDIVQ